MSVALTLEPSGALPVVKLHPSVVMEILTLYNKRTERNARIIGSLLGTNRDGVCEVTNCFGVPFTEKENQMYVTINTEYHSRIYACHKKINKKEIILGWFSTTTPDNRLVVDNCSLINEYYSGECQDPIHLVVDTNLTSSNINIKGFTSKQLIIDNIPVANMFHEIKVEVVMTDAELTCFYHMIKGQDSEIKLKDEPKIVSSFSDAKLKQKNAISKLLQVLDNVQGYVDNVVTGKSLPITAIGIQLNDVLSSLHSLKREDIELILSEKKQDLLMISYLVSLVQTQINISEKLTSIL